MSSNVSPEVTVEQANAFLAKHAPFCKELNIICQSLEPDMGVARFRYDPKWTRPGGIVSGPVLMALADVAVYLSIFTRLGITPMAVTNDLTMTFLRPGVESDIDARATLHKVGRRVAYASVDVTEVGKPDRLIAQATSSYVLESPRD